MQLISAVAGYQVLAALSVCPDKGGLLGRLAWALGRGIGEYLLQQAQWVLQVWWVLASMHAGPMVVRSHVTSSLYLAAPFSCQWQGRCA